MKEKLYSQEEVDRLVIEARIDELEGLTRFFDSDDYYNMTDNTSVNDIIYDHIKALNHRKDK